MAERNGVAKMVRVCYGGRKIIRNEYQHIAGSKRRLTEPTFNEDIINCVSFQNGVSTPTKKRLPILTIEDNPSQSPLLQTIRRNHEAAPQPSTPTCTKRMASDLSLQGHETRVSIALMRWSRGCKPGIVSGRSLGGRAPTKVGQTLQETVFRHC